MPRLPCCATSGKTFARSPIPSWIYEEPGWPRGHLMELLKVAHYASGIARPDHLDDSERKLLVILHGVGPFAC